MCSEPEPLCLNMFKRFSSGSGLGTRGVFRFGIWADRCLNWTELNFSIPTSQQKSKEQGTEFHDPELIDMMMRQPHIYMPKTQSLAILSTF